MFCAPIAGGDAWRDVLYLQLPADLAGPSVLDFAQAVARQIHLLETSVLHAEESARRRFLDQQLAMAREVQSSFVPQSLALSPQLDAALVYEPAYWVGGDYCDL